MKKITNKFLILLGVLSLMNIQAQDKRFIAPENFGLHALSVLQDE